MIWYDMIYDMIWYMIWYDIWYDMIWYDATRHDTTRYDTIRYDIWYDMIWYIILIWHDMVYDVTWHNMTWHGMVWHGMTWHDMNAFTHHFVAQFWSKWSDRNALPWLVSLETHMFSNRLSSLQHCQPQVGCGSKRSTVYLSQVWITQWQTRSWFNSSSMGPL